MSNPKASFKQTSAKETQQYLNLGRLNWLPSLSVHWINVPPALQDCRMRPAAPFLPSQSLHCSQSLHGVQGPQNRCQWRFLSGCISLLLHVLYNATISGVSPDRICVKCKCKYTHLHPVQLYPFLLPVVFFFLALKVYANSISILLETKSNFVWTFWMANVVMLCEALNAWWCVRSRFEGVLFLRLSSLTKGQCFWTLERVKLVDVCLETSYSY